MGKRYSWNINPFRDFLLRTLLYGGDIADKDLIVDIYVGFTMILDGFMDDNDIKHLDFDINKDDDNFTVVGKNAITALWLIGIFPSDLDLVSKNSLFLVGDRKYEYNKKTYNFRDDKKGRVFYPAFFVVVNRYLFNFLEAFITFVFKLSL